MTTRVLLLSSLYPNAEFPGRGLFVRERMRQLRRRSDFDWQVVAPVPWFPLTHRRFGDYARFARVPFEESGPDGRVLHPRYLVIPKIGDALAPLAYAAAVANAIRRHRIDFDVIDAHFFFPDGVAATLLGRRLGKPVVVTARGSDINLMPDELAAGRWIRWAARRCDRLIAVSHDLGRRLRALSYGQPVLIAPNGVDTDRFRALGDTDLVRADLGVRRPAVLCVGNLIQLKGHELVLEAVSGLADVELVIAGQGPLRETLEANAHALGMSDRVRFLGVVDQDELIQYYNACQMLVLASSSEGSPNVVLEALACGTPVIATIDQVVPRGPSSSDVCVVERSVPAIRAAIVRLLSDRPDRPSIRGRALSLGWDETCRALGQALHDPHTKSALGDAA